MNIWFVDWAPLTELIIYLLTSSKLFPQNSEYLSDIMFPLRKDDLSSPKCLLLLMIDPHSPIVSQDSQAGPGTLDGGTKDGHSQIKTPDSSVAQSARLSCYKAQSKLYTFEITPG